MDGSAPIPQPMIPTFQNPINQPQQVQQPVVPSYQTPVQQPVVPSYQTPVQQPVLPQPTAQPSVQQPVYSNPLQQNIVPTQYTQAPNTMQQPAPHVPQQQKPVVDQRSMPSPTIISKQCITYNLISPPPSSLQPFVSAVDNKSSPKNIRLSLFSPATNGSLLKQAGIPFSCEVTPFAKMFEGEELESIKMDPAQIHRCPRCGGYINPFCSFEEGGKKMRCNLCQYLSTVEDNYFSPLRSDGRREDTEQRLELLYGTNSYELTGNDPSYINASCGRPMRFVFLIETSKASLETVFTSIMAVLQTALQSLPDAAKDLECGFVTYSNYIQYWLLGDTPRMVKVFDTAQPFIPVAPKNFFKPIKEVIDQFPMLQEQMLKYASDAVTRNNCMISAIESASQIIGCTGKILAFTTSRPTVGNGAINRKDTEIANNPQAQGNLYINSLAKKLSKSCIAVDLFVLANAFSDIVTIGELSRFTGGSISFYPKYTNEQQLELQQKIMASFDLKCGFDVEIRLRTSAGVDLKEYLGNMMKCEDMMDTVRIGYMNSEQSIIGTFEYNSDLEEFVGFFIQAVILYTDAYGKKQLKVFNSFHSVAKELTEVFKRADLDVILSTLIRSTIKGGNFRNNESLHKELIDKAATILAGYRKYCSSHAKSSILLLPDSLKLLPVFILGALKTPAFMPMARIQSCIPSYLYPGAPSDYMFSSIYETTSASINRLMQQYYNTTYDVTGHITGEVTEENMKEDSLRVRLSEQNFSDQKVYFMSTGRNTYKLLVGKQVSESVLTQLFGQVVDLQSGEDLTNMLYTNILSNANSVFTQFVYWYTSMHLIPMVTIEVVPFTVSELAPYMVEDKTVKGLAYFDLLVYCHKLIQNKLN